MKSFNIPKLLVMTLIVSLLGSSVLPGYKNGGKADAAALSQTIEDFTDVSDWTTNRASIAASNIGTVNTGYVKIGTERGYGSVDKKVTYDLEEYPTLTVDVAQLDAGAKWALKVNDTDADQSDKLLENDTTKTGKQTYNLKALTGWSGKKTFKIRLYVIAANGSGKGVQFSSIAISGSDYVPVSSIHVKGESQTLEIKSNGGKLQMIAEVKPENATTTNVNWSVKATDGKPTDLAEISEAGMLTSRGNGQVRVIASAKDASGISGEAAVTLSGQKDILRELPEYVGNVRLWGDSDFDSDSIKNSDANQWRWLSYPLSRLSLNPKQSKLKSNLDLSLEYMVGGLGTAPVQREQQSVVRMSVNNGVQQEASSVSTSWYPYKLTFDALYSNLNAKISGYEFFADKDSIIRVFNLDGPDGKTMTLSGVGNGSVTWLDDKKVILIESTGYSYAINLAGIDGSGQIYALSQKPSVDGSSWSISILFGAGTSSVAYGYGFSTAAEGSQKAIERAKQLFDQPVAVRLAQTKAYWDGTLGHAPKPQNWGITEVDSQGVTPEQHRRSYYAAWTYLLDSILTETPEKDFNYRQVTLGRGSGWNSGHEKSPRSAAWESFYNIQLVSYLDPATAWSALEGFMSLIDQNGSLSGEGLPTQKAHTAWVVYSMDPDKDRLQAVYPAIKRHLKFSADNPRWIYGSHNYSDEKDISFVSHFLKDADYAINIAKELGLNEDVAMWQKLQMQLTNQARDWFFAPDKIYNFSFVDKGVHYYADRMTDDPNYIAELLVNQLPQDLTERLVAYYKQTSDPNKELLGWSFAKYGDVANTAVGLFDSGLTAEARQFIDSMMRHSIRTGEFCETMESGNFNPQGVTPSSFTATLMIDYTWLKNGVRYDQGKPTALIDPADKSAKSIADGIPYIVTPAKNAEKLQLPAVPKGFEIAIESSGNPAAVSVDGIIHTSVAERVDLVLRVTKQSDQSNALTRTLSVPLPVKVQEVVVSTANQRDQITEKYGTVQMMAVIKPDNTDESLNWSVSGVDGKPTSAAQITKDGVLTATGDGTVRVVATATSGVKGFKDMVIANQNVTSLAFNKTATASRSESGSLPAASAVDENPTTRWAAGTGGEQWISVDLGRTYNINKVVLSWEAAYAKGYRIQVSGDASNWSDAYTTSTGGGGLEVLLFPSTAARYVRMLTTANGPFNSYSLYEFKVYPDPESIAATPVTGIVVSGKDGVNAIVKKNAPLQMTASVSPADATDSRVSWKVTDVVGNPTTLAAIDARGMLTPKDNGSVKVLATAADGSGITGEATVIITGQDTMNAAMGKAVTVSSFDSYAKEGAVDGNTGTRWASSGNEANPWIVVDLGSVYKIDRVVLNWEAAYADGYRIQVSNDTSEWKEVYSTTTGKGSIEDISFDAQNAKFVRLYVTSKKTEWGASLWEFEVYTAPATIPGTPDGVQAAGRDGSAEVSFLAPADNGGSGILKYKVTAWLNAESVQTAEGTASPIFVTGLSNGKVYTFTVSAINAKGSSPMSVPSNEVTPMASVPAVPDNLTAVPGDGQIDLTWDAVAGADSYEVYSYEGTAEPRDQSSWKLVKSELPDTWLTVTALTNGTSYAFAVKAVNAAGESEFSQAAVAVPTTVLPDAPDAPDHLAAVAGDGQVVLSWNAMPRSVTYAVYRFEGTEAPLDPAQWIQVVEAVRGTSYTVTGLTNGLSYVFAVKSANAGGVSDFSGTAVATPGAPQPQLPEAPDPLSATAGNGQVTLNWNSVAGAVSYAVYKHEGASAPEIPEAWELVKEGITESAYTVAGLTNGTSYAFTVKAVNLGGASELSGAVIAVPVALQPSVDNNPSPSFPTATDNSVIKSVTGTIVLPAGRAGEVSLGDQVVLSVPAGTAEQEQRITIGKVADIAQLKNDQGTLISDVFEVLKNIIGNFKHSVTLSLKFDPSAVKTDQRVAIFYYDEARKVWVEVGGKVEGSRITAELDHFTKFAVLAVDVKKDEGSVQPQLLPTFTDIAGHWAENLIRRAAGQKLAGGYTDGSFQPNKSVTRAEFTVMLMNALKSEMASAAPAFKDQEKIGAWAAEAVAQAVAAGIISGYEDGNFRPDVLITRAEMAVMIAKALDLPLDSAGATNFTDDVKILAWAKTAVKGTQALGILEGRGAGRFAPAEPATRAEAVTVLLRMLEHKDGK